MSANVDYLRENGPATVDELPSVDVSVYDRQSGVWGFKHSPHSGTPSPFPAREPKTVYYLRDRHAPEVVLERFFEVNRGIAEPLLDPETRHRTAFKSCLDSTFAPVVDEALDRVADDREVSEA